MGREPDKHVPWNGGKRHDTRMEEERAPPPVDNSLPNTAWTEERAVDRDLQDPAETVGSSATTTGTARNRDEDREKREKARKTRLATSQQGKRSWNPIFQAS